MAAELRTLVDAGIFRVIDVLILAAELMANVGEFPIPHDLGQASSKFITLSSSSHTLSDCLKAGGLICHHWSQWMRPT